MSNDKRSVSRIPYYGMVQFSQKKFATLTFEATCVDISSSGMRIVTDCPLTAGEEIRLSIACAGIKFERPGRVQWTYENDDHRLFAGCIFTISSGSSTDTDHDQ